MDHHSHDGSMMGLGMKGEAGITTGRHLLMASNFSPFDDYLFDGLSGSSAMQTLVNSTMIESLPF